MTVINPLSPDSASSLDVESGASGGDSYSHGMAIALRKLNAHARTRHEISRVLSDKGVEESVSLLVLDRLTELGYIDDSEFAQAWVRSRIKSRGLAPSVLRRELQTKGVDPELIEAALSTTNPLDTSQRARELAEKKYRSLSGVSESIAMRRISALLQRKGYSFAESLSIARSVVGGCEIPGEILDFPND